MKITKIARDLVGRRDYYSLGAKHVKDLAEMYLGDLAIENAPSLILELRDGLAQIRYTAAKTNRPRGGSIVPLTEAYWNGKGPALSVDDARPMIAGEGRPVVGLLFVDPLKPNDVVMLEAYYLQRGRCISNQRDELGGAMRETPAKLQPGSQKKTVSLMHGATVKSMKEVKKLLASNDGEK